MFHRYVDVRLTGMSSFGCNKDYTIRTTYTVHGTCRSIFQYRERFYFRNIEVVQGAFYTIDKYERGVAALERAHTANPEFGVVVTRFTGTLNGDDTPDVTGEVVAQRTSRPYL